MFKEERAEYLFDWKMLGDINEGRPNLGVLMHLHAYRLLQFVIRDVLIKESGVEKANEIIYKAGELAGREIFKNVITKKENYGEFVQELQGVLLNLKIGILRLEKEDLENLEFVLTVAEDLDCSGLPVCDERICTYDEGLISGLLQEFTGKKFTVKEVDCWCSGGRICRFVAKAQQLEK